MKNYVKTYFKDFVPETVEKLTSSESSPGRIYSLVKVNKESNPVKPVVSMICTQKYLLAKCFDAIIKLNTSQT